MATKRKYIVVDKFDTEEFGPVELISIKNRFTNVALAAAVRKVGEKDFLGMYKNVGMARAAHKRVITHPVKETRPARDYPQFTGTSKTGGKKR